MGGDRLHRAVDDRAVIPEQEPAQRRRQRQADHREARIPRLENLLVDLHTGFKLTHRSRLLTQSQVCPLVAVVGGIPHGRQRRTATGRPASTAPSAATACGGSPASASITAINTRALVQSSHCYGPP